MSQHDIGLVGLAVMGQNLVLNMANNGFSVGVYNRTTATTDEFVGGLKNEPAGTEPRLLVTHVGDVAQELLRGRSTDAYWSCRPQGRAA